MQVEVAQEGRATSGLLEGTLSALCVGVFLAPLNQPEKGKAKPLRRYPRLQIFSQN